MSRARLAIALALVLAAGPAPTQTLEASPTGGERVIARLSQTNVAITTDFSGSEIFIYGAVGRSAPAPEGALDVIVTVTGPSHPVTVRRKERALGIWMNGPGVRIDAAPSFYAVASTRPVREILSHTDDLRHRIGLSEVIRLVDAPAWLGGERGAYLKALERLRRRQGLYFERPSGVRLVEDTLFETALALPADLIEGIYEARVFLLRDRTVIDVQATTIEVRKVGLERLIDVVAHEHAALYGIASVVVALMAGWGASALMRWLMP